MPQSLLSVLFTVLIVLGCPALQVLAAELKVLHGATLMEDALNDGDSFKVTADGRELHLQLYYVDCLETTYDAEADREWLLEQQGYFGLYDLDAVVRFGKQAAEYVQQVLSRPFTVHTSYEPAKGRSANGRVYAFVETHDGHDLGHLLVEQGLARIYGETHLSPGGLRSDQVKAKLEALEDCAMVNRAGIWAEIKPDVLTNKWKRQHEDEQKHKEFGKDLKEEDAPSPTNPIAVNHASQTQLESIHGIGQVLAERIIDGRPWRSVDNLLEVRGIGEKTLENIAPFLMVGCQQ